MRGACSGDGNLADRLEELKASGSALLVVGDVPDDCYARVSRRMLGDPTHAPRRRALVVDEAADAVLDERLPHADRQMTRVITHGTDGRSATGTAAETAGALPSNSPTYVAADDLTGLGRAVLDAIEDLDDGALAPATLRVGFDTLQMLVDTAPDVTVFAFLDLLAHRVRRANGIVHVRLAKPRDAYHVDLLQPVFDAVVELRVDGGDVEQRWEFFDGTPRSEWIALEE